MRGEECFHFIRPFVNLYHFAPMTQIMKNSHIPSSADPADKQQLMQEKMGKLANQLSAEVIESFKKFPDNFSLHQQTLIDLKQKVTDSAVELEEGDSLGNLANRSELLWALALHLPDFDTDSLYQKRSSLASIAIAILIGWLVGGFIATILGLIGLGGEILRPLAIFGCIWLGEWISTNPNARRILLTSLGLGALVRFTSMVVGGLFRFTSFSALRQAIFGAARPNIFKNFWLIGGALFILLLLSKKISGMDLPAFRQSLQSQIEQRLNFLYFTLKELDNRDYNLKKIAAANSENEKDTCARTNCALASAVLDVLGSLDPDTRKYLKSSLEAIGYTPPPESDNAEYFIWNSEIHSPLYDTIGIVRNGDRCRVLKAPYTVDGKIVRGHAQRATDIH